MKIFKLILVLALVFSLVFSVGCFPIVPEPEEPIENFIVCEGGHYSIHYGEWSFTGCEDDPWYVAGVYWHNANGEMFLIGDTVWPESVLDVYGLCPVSYIEEIL